MRIEEISGRDLIVELPNAATPEGAISQLVEKMGRRRGINSGKLSEYRSAIMERHRKNPCGLARGLAFPNARLRDLPQPCLAVGMSSSGIDLGGKDGSLSRVLLVYLGCAKASPDEREMLDRLSRALVDPSFAAQVVSCEDAEGLWQTLCHVDRVVAEFSGKGGSCRTR